MTMIRTTPILTIVLIGVLAAAALVRAQGGDEAAVMLENAIQTELVDGDLNKAVELYAEIVDRFSHERPVAAQALLHIGQSYEKLGEPKAREAYERLLREYADQSRVLVEARAGLAALVEVRPAVEASGAGVRQAWTRPAPAVRAFGPGLGRFLIFSDLAVHNTQTGENRRLSSGTRSAAYPILSPDSRQVAYLSWSAGSENSRNARSPAAMAATNRRLSAELRVVGLDGSGDRVLVDTEDVRWLRPFAWSPDGTQILTVVERGDATNQIALVSVADGSSRILKSLEWRYPESLSFSSDGRYVAYTLPTRPDAGQHDVFLLQIDGGRERPLAERRYSVALSSQNTERLSEDQRIIHVLNRLGFGPRLGDIERVKAMGIEAYIDEQLHPERILDPIVEEKLADFMTLKMGSEELTALLADGFMPVPQLEVRERVFEKRRMAERAGASDTAQPMSMEMFRRMAAKGPQPVPELQVARLVRAVYSERQLQEKMVDFWMNHFNINFPGGGAQAADYEQNVIRPRTLGKFEDLLMAVAKHPAMLRYLDNRRSSAPAEVIEARVAALKPTLGLREYLALRERMPFLEQARGLNENYARELMELHTLGIGGGYTQEDIIEVAKVLTGWTTTAWTRADGVTEGGNQGGTFTFDPLLHVDGDKVVLGQTIPSGGIEEGEQLLRMLVRHPSTARFISTKLVRRFVADDPPADVVDAASRTFQRTDGDIREVLRTIFTSPGFRSAAAYGAKIKKPLELVASSLRAVNAQFDEPLPRTAGFPIATSAFSLIMNVGGQGPNGRVSTIERMGERLYNYEAPDGNPDVGAAWMNSNALLERLDFANDLAANRIPGLGVDLRAAQVLLEQLGLPRPTSEQIEQTRAMMRNSASGLTQPTASMRRPAMTAGAAGGGAGARANDVTPEAVTVAAMLGSPQFQKR